VTDSAISNTAEEEEDEEAGEDLGGLDDLLASLKAEYEAVPKRGRGRAKRVFCSDNEHKHLIPVTVSTTIKTPKKMREDVYQLRVARE
jgi:hypothetical protein